MYPHCRGRIGYRRGFFTITKIRRFIVVFFRLGLAPFFKKHTLAIFSFQGAVSWCSTCRSHGLYTEPIFRHRLAPLCCTNILSQNWRFVKREFFTLQGALCRIPSGFTLAPWVCSLATPKVYHRFVGLSRGNFSLCKVLYAGSRPGSLLRRGVFPCDT